MHGNVDGTYLDADGRPQPVDARPPARLRPVTVRQTEPRFAEVDLETGRRRRFRELVAAARGWRLLVVTPAGTCVALAFLRAGDPSWVYVMAAALVVISVGQVAVLVAAVRTATGRAARRRRYRAGQTVLGVMVGFSVFGDLLAEAVRASEQAGTASFRFALGCVAASVAWDAVSVWRTHAVRLRRGLR